MDVAIWVERNDMGVCPFDTNDAWRLNFEMFGILACRENGGNVKILIAAAFNNNNLITGKTIYKKN